MHPHPPNGFVLQKPRQSWGFFSVAGAQGGEATRAYAWSSPIEGSDKRRFFAVLHQGAITGPAEAVRAAIVAEHRSTQ
jgi:hypothetical protein